MTQTIPVVLVENVVKTYRIGKTNINAVRGVSLSIQPQSFTMLVGPSGSGKTTLLNLMGCIDRPTQGAVTISGQDIAALDDDALSDLRARQIGFVFQGFNLIQVLSAFENVEYPLLVAGMPARQRKAAAMEMLDLVGLADQHGQRPNELSGGQKQRVAIARALVKKPQFIIADEPTANLDSATGAKIIALMRKMQIDLKTTFIFSTHDPELISHAESTVVIRDGLIANQRQVVAA